MEAVIAEFLRQGALGLVIAALLLGWLVPKYAVDDLRARIVVKDKIIERQSLLIEKLAARTARLRGESLLVEVPTAAENAQAVDDLEIPATTARLIRKPK